MFLIVIFPVILTEWIEEVVITLMKFAVRAKTVTYYLLASIDSRLGNQGQPCMG